MGDAEPREGSADHWWPVSGHRSPPSRILAISRRKDDVLTITAAINASIEGCATLHPEQWIWLHRRWPD